MILKIDSLASVPAWTVIMGLVASFPFASSSVFAQEKSVKPGINDSFLKPNPGEFVERFEIESREVFALREEIIKTCKIEKGMTLADIGAGTGLFSRMFAKEVGPEGKVLAVDIAENFLEHIKVTSRSLGLRNIEPILCTPDSTMLPADSIDLAYICDTYHHFEFPQKTLASLHQALKPNGRVILIDFKRIKGESSDWTMNHVRAGQEVFEEEIIAAGFRKVREHKELLKENYFVEFEKANPESK
jgi:SAM-dependent methyltransferase